MCVLRRKNQTARQHLDKVFRGLVDVQGEFQDGIWRLELKGHGDSWRLAPLEDALQAPFRLFLDHLRGGLARGMP